MIASNQVREKYLRFFEKRGHKIIPPAPLVLEKDPTTLFTSSGMQPLVPYLMGEKHPDGTRLVDSQPSIRLQDIEEVGDNRHTTYFEMLGNWSLGDYFKEEQLPWVWEFLTKELKLSPAKLYVSVFEGNDSVPEDTESFNIWKDLGVSENHIFEYGVKKNWWSRSGTPDEMPEGEIGGPDSEIFFDFGEKLKLHENSEFKSEKCHPNCDCGRFLEIGNSVFIQYKKMKDGSLEELPQKNVDFGGGLERITAALNNDPDVFKTDIFWPTIMKLEKITGKKYEDEKKNFRIVADHLRASEALINAGVVPSNKMHGYILRRLIRRMAIKFSDVDKVIRNTVILEELKKFKVSLDNGLKEIKKVKKITGKIAFDLYQSYGFPLELTIELFTDKGQKVDLKEFGDEFEKHRTASKSLSTGIFKGGLEDISEETTKLHTATHLLHSSLRKVLGDVVSQKGSHITKDRLRFDFSYSEKLNEEQVTNVFDTINRVVDEDLPVTFIETTPEDAIEKGALHFFAEKYGEKVKMYTIGSNEDYFSREICGGPHVTSTKLVGNVRMIKQEKIGSGVIRIYVGLSSKTKT
ncbi:MAG: alanine--tRNA ligase-related protein [bacterium]|nr:MAG: alanine--tRNA ligase-related protein [bacterium]